MTAGRSVRPDTDPGHLLSLAVELAARAADIHRAGRHGRLHVREKTSPFDLVTRVDHEAERAIVEALTEARPDDAILGEEGTRRDGSTGIRWVIDPLDGTANYVYGYPAHAVSIGVEIGGRRALGVVFDTGRAHRYTGIVGGAATMDAAPVSVTGQEDPATAMLATGFSFDAHRRGRQGAVLARLLPLVRDVRRSGAAAIDLVAVASGQVDAYYETALRPWDVAAGLAVAEAAGATVLAQALPGEPGVSVLAANPVLFERLLPILREAGVSFDPSLGEPGAGPVGEAEP